MGRIVAGLASSHALALQQPDDWDRRRQMTRANYARRYGIEPPERPEIEGETLAANQERHKRLHAGLQGLRQQLAAIRPDTLVLIGDDQDENFRTDNLPQFAIYTGESVLVEDREAHGQQPPPPSLPDSIGSPGRAGRGNAGEQQSPPPPSRGRVGERVGPQAHPCDVALSRAILEHMVEADFDLASSNRLANDRLRSHAHVQILRYMDVPRELPIVPIFVNAIHVPAPTPRRCYQFGAELRRAIEAQDDGKRVAIYASGGLSHYTAGFPWPDYHGPATLGYIDRDFDRRTVQWIEHGQGSSLQTLSSQDLLDSGNIEMRQWIVLMGALGDIPPTELVYEPFFRGLMGMAAGYWHLETAAPLPLG